MGYMTKNSQSRRVEDRKTEMKKGCDFSWADREEMLSFFQSQVRAVRGELGGVRATRQV